MLAAELTGGYAALLGPAFGLAGAVVGVVSVTTLLGFLACLLMLRVAIRHGY
jgi:hypothetical protein